MTFPEGRVRTTSSAGANPRVSREVSDLDVGETYRVTSNVYHGTAGGNSFFRVSATANLTLGDYVNNSAAIDRAIDETFVAPAGGVVYIGIVVAVTATGQYSETDDTFTIVKE